MIITNKTIYVRKVEGLLSYYGMYSWCDNMAYAWKVMTYPEPHETRTQVNYS